MAVHILHPCKATFIHIPKTGGTSITKWLEKNFKTDNRRKHGYLSHAEAIWKDLGWTFSIVRNPFDRIASSYFYQKKFYTDRLTKIHLGQAKNLTRNFGKKKK